MSRPKSQRWDQPGERPIPTPIRREDGELYKRPSDDSPEWIVGYEDGFEVRPERTSIGTLKQISDYIDGYSAGQADREEVERSGSSNA
jgi:hypothetical protein